MSDVASLPLGVFDSGIGGLTVVRELMRQLPAESILYFGDTARVPYGTKSPETVRQYSREAAAFLLSRGVKMIVVACNTASAHAEYALRDAVRVPVVGVVEPGARAAVQATRSGRVGVLGTAGTIASGAYDQAVRRLLPEARVFAQPCALFVPLVEEGLLDHPATRLIAEEYLGPLREVDVDTVILGCTHYPLLRGVLTDILGAGVTLVDSAEETAAEVRRLLDREGLLRRTPGEPAYGFSVSDVPSRFKAVARQFLGKLPGLVEHVSIEGFNLAA